MSAAIFWCVGPEAMTATLAPPWPGRAATRATAPTVALVVIYYLLPLNHSSTWAAVTILVIGLVLFIALIAFQVRSIGRSRFPALRAIEALATSIPLFLLLFASVYVVMA